jgi:hypothetical protein
VRSKRRRENHSKIVPVGYIDIEENCLPLNGQDTEIGGLLGYWSVAGWNLEIKVMGVTRTQ